MKHIQTRNHLQGSLILFILALMMGCASGGKTVPSQSDSKSVPVTAATPATTATITILPASPGEFIIQGNNVDDIAGFDVTINYDNAMLSAPTVTKLTDNPGAMMASNTATPGTIRLVMISTKPFSGTARLASASFASVKGQGNISITSVSMVNAKGALVK